MKKPALLCLLITFLVLLLLCVCFFFFTGLGIVGLVLHHQEQTPLAYARVTLNNKQYLTDEKGQFKSYLPVYSTINLLVERNGFKNYLSTLEPHWRMGQKNLLVQMEPITYTGIIESAKQNLASYTHYIFRYSWFTNIGREDEERTYMIYKLGDEGVFRFKYLQDDRLGNLLSAREIIQSGNTIYFQEFDSGDWIKIREEDIMLSKMQDPFDILLIFSKEEPPLFLFEGENILYEFPDGLWRNPSDKEQMAKPSDPIAVTPVFVFSAEWKNNDSTSKARLHLNEDYQLLRIDFSNQSFNEKGDLIEQKLWVHISSINQAMKIDIPEA